MSAILSRGLPDRPVERHLLFLHVRVHDDVTPGQDFAVKDFHRERVLDEALDGALQGPRAERQALRLEAYKSFMKSFADNSASRKIFLSNPRPTTLWSGTVIDLFPAHERRIWLPRWRTSQ